MEANLDGASLTKLITIYWPWSDASVAAMNENQQLGFYWPESTPTWRLVNCI